MKSDGGVKQVIILGALSAIGEATARLYAAEGARLVVAGRNETRLRQVGDDLLARGAAECRSWPIDLAAADAAAEFAKMVQALDDRVDAVLLFYGVLGDQREAERDPAMLRNIIAVNFASAAEWAVAAANQLEKQGGGVLVAVSSVAGDRGRQSNYVYGAAKAGLTTLVEGIAHRLAPSGARAVALKLGTVDTPMTAQRQEGRPAHGETRPGRPHHQGDCRPARQAGRLCALVLALDHAGRPLGADRDLPQDKALGRESASRRRAKRVRRQ